MFEFLKFDRIKGNEVDLVLDFTTTKNDKVEYGPTYFFDIVLSDTNIPIGKIDFRVGQNENTYYGGNLGYNIKRMYRGNSYASKACQLLKQVALGHNFDKVYISCATDNVPSIKTIEKLGASLIGVENIPKNSQLYNSLIPSVYVFEWDIKK